MLMAKKEKVAVWVPGYHALGWAVPSNVDKSCLTEIGSKTTTLRPRSNVKIVNEIKIQFSSGSSATNMPQRTWSSRANPSISISFRIEKGCLYVKGDWIVIYACFCHPRVLNAAKEVQAVCRQWNLPVITARWIHYKPWEGYVRVVLFSGDWIVEEK